MRVSRITQPAFEPVSVSRAKANSNIADSDTTFNGFFADSIREARDYLERLLGCCFATSTYTFTLPGFPDDNDPIPLPIWPIKSITSVEFINSDGVGDEIAIGSVVQPIGDEPFELELEDHANWPTTRDTPNAVTITCVAGWETQRDIPPIVGKAMLMLCSHWFENREAVLIGTISKEVEFGVNAVIDSLRPGEDNIA